MNRKVLLIEPDYKNKYLPMGLMKLATYYRMVGDDVRFYKGDMRSLAVELICRGFNKPSLYYFSRSFLERLLSYEF